MIKTVIVIGFVGMVGLFVYFYASNPSDVSRSDKAKQAAIDVGDAVRDKGVAGLVDVRLKTKFGLDATRFLHTYYNDGQVVVYGLVPSNVDLQLLQDEIAKVPGVSGVEVLVQARPEQIVSLKSILSEKPEPSPEAEPEAVQP